MGVVWSLWFRFRFGAGAMFVFLALSTLYPNDRLSMAMKTCRAAKLYRRPLNLLSVLNRPLKVSDKRLVPNFFYRHHHQDTATDYYPSLRMHAWDNNKLVLLMFTYAVLIALIGLMAYSYVGRHHCSTQIVRV